MELSEEQKENRLIYETIVNQLNERHNNRENLTNDEAVLFLSLQKNDKNNGILSYLVGTGPAVFKAISILAGKDANFLKMLKKVVEYYLRQSEVMSEKVAGDILAGEIMIASFDELPGVTPPNELPKKKPLVN